MSFEIVSEAPVDTIKILAQKIEGAVRAGKWVRARELNGRLAELEVSQKHTFFLHKPEALQIELTGRCNARCVMCSHFYEWNDCGQDLQEDGIRLVENYLPFCRIAVLNGYGEPLLSNYFLPCLHLLRKYQSSAIITTNLSVLTNEMLYEFPKVFQKINVSCNGPDAKRYEKIHQGLSFQRFQRNLKRLIEVCGGEIVCLSCVAMAETIPYALDLVRFAGQNGIREIRFGRLGVNAFLKNYEQDLIHYPNAASFYFQEAENAAKDLGIRLVFPDNFQGVYTDFHLKEELRTLHTLPFRYGNAYQPERRAAFLSCQERGEYGNPVRHYDTSLVPVDGICDWVAKGLYIDMSGAMHPCCECPSVNYNDQWNGETARHLRGMFYSGILPAHCKNCPFIINQELSMLKCRKDPSLYRAGDYLEHKIDQ